MIHGSALAAFAGNQSRRTQGEQAGADSANAPVDSSDDDSDNDSDDGECESAEEKVDGPDVAAKRLALRIKNKPRFLIAHVPRGAFFWERLKAVNAGNSSVLHYLIRADPDQDAVAQQQALIYVCVQKGANVNAKNKYGETPLHQAVMRRLKGMTEYLISQRPRWS